MTESIAFGEAPLTIEQVCAPAGGSASARLGSSAAYRAHLEHGKAVLHRALERGDAVGTSVMTGLGCLVYAALRPDQARVQDATSAMHTEDRPMAAELARLLERHHDGERPIGEIDLA